MDIIEDHIIFKQGDELMEVPASLGTAIAESLQNQLWLNGQLLPIDAVIKTFLKGVSETVQAYGQDYLNALLLHQIAIKIEAPVSQSPAIEPTKRAKNLKKEED